MNIGQHYFAAYDIMSDVVNIIHNHVITKIATDDCAVVQTYGHAYIMVFQGNRFQLSDADQSEKLAVFYQFRVKSIRYVDLLPIV